MVIGTYPGSTEVFLQLREMGFYKVMRVDELDDFPDERERTGRPYFLPFSSFNLVHAESMVDGVVGPASAEWLRVLERIGQLVGRPGLAAYEALEGSRDKAAHAAWMAQHAGDPLFDAAAARLKQL